MKSYYYNAKDKQGNAVDGEVQARDEKEAAKLVRERGLILINLRSSGGIRGQLSQLSKRVSRKDVTTVTRQLATMVNAGMPLSEALNILSVQANDRLESIMAQILADIEGGKSFYQALEKHPQMFTPTYVALIRAGETGGVLDKVLMRLADNLEKEESFRGKVKSAMIYPVIVVVAMLAASLIMIIFVIPRLTSVYEQFGADIPFSAKVFMGISTLFTDYWYAILALTLIAYFGFKAFHKTPEGKRKIEEFIFRIPIVGDLKKQIILTELSRTMSITIGAGVPILDSLNISGDVIDSVTVTESVRDVAKKVEKGFPISYSFAQHPDHFPYILSQMIAVGEETGKMEEVLDKLSKVFESESEQKVKALTSAIEPVVMIFLGIGVFFLVVAVILPIYNLTSVI